MSVLTSKELYLRIDCSLYTNEKLKDIRSFFGNYFTSVSFLDIPHQKTVIKNMVDTKECKIISLDKYIPTEHNIDTNRVYDLKTGNYLYHNIKFNGKIARDEHVILYDHDAVSGLGLKLVTGLLEKQGCTVETFVFKQLSKEESKTIEILDLDDFINSGLVCEIDGQLKRVHYSYNEIILNKRASIPIERYTEFCEGLNNLNLI